MEPSFVPIQVLVEAQIVGPRKWRLGLMDPLEWIRPTQPEIAYMRFNHLWRSSKMVSSSLMDPEAAAMCRNPARNDEEYFPQTTSWDEEIEGRLTEFAVTVLEKKLLVIITQCGKVGSWITASIDGEPCITDPNFPPDVTYDTTVVLSWSCNYHK